MKNRANMRKVNKNKKIPIIVIAGATASGKSKIALKLAEDIGGEIISCDSMQLYKGMDIGTAKASLGDRERVKHHLIDVQDIAEPFSVKAFMSLAKEAIYDVYSRGNIPILVGGTGLYIKMVLEDTILPETESVDNLRAAFTSLAKSLGNEKLHQILRIVDFEGAENIHHNNLKRVIRALELFHITGKTQYERHKESSSIGSPYDGFCIYLKGRREWLYNRINERVELFFEQGLLEEVRELYRLGLKNTPSASQGIGYKEFFPFFEGKISLEEVKEQIKKVTRNYAKRQETFFSKMHFDFVLDAEEESCEVKVNNIKTLLKDSGLYGIISI